MADRAARAGPAEAGRDGIDATLKAHRLDALIAPTASPAWLSDWLNGDRKQGSETGDRVDF